MNIPIFLISAISFTIGLQVILKKSDNGFEEMKRNLNEIEKKANSTIIEDGEKNFPYVKADTSELPIKEYSKDSRLKRKQDSAVRKAKLTMVRFPIKMTNTDIKLTYGANNFDKAVLYEEHFNGYVRALYDWARELKKAGEDDDALKVAYKAAQMNSDSGKVYSFLAELYYEKNMLDELKVLYETAEKIDFYSKEAVMKSIRQKMQ